jgi:hypothetical protein
LCERIEDRPEAMTRISAGTCSTDDVQSEAIVPIEDLQPDVVKLVKQFPRPLFWLFDFYEVRDAEYEKLVGYRLREWGVREPRTLAAARPAAQ